MNYTETYHLPQWEENDQILRTDFNTAMSAIAQGLQELHDTQESSEEARLQGENALREEFEAIIERVDDDVTKITPYFGTYTGNGRYMTEDGSTVGKQVILRFRPKLLIISRGWSSQSYMHHGFYVAMEPLADEASPIFRFTNNGFLVGRTDASYEAKLNESGTIYPYVAFR